MRGYALYSTKTLKLRIFGVLMSVALFICSTNNYNITYYNRIWMPATPSHSVQGIVYASYNGRVICKPCPYHTAPPFNTEECQRSSSSIVTAVPKAEEASLQWVLPIFAFFERICSRIPWAIPFPMPPPSPTLTAH